MHHNCVRPHIRDEHPGEPVHDGFRLAHHHVGCHLERSEEEAILLQHVSCWRLVRTTRIAPSCCRRRALASLDCCATNHERGASSTTSHACAAPNPQDAFALSFISGSGVGDRPANPIPDRDYSSGSSGHHAIAPTHSVSKEEVRCFHDRWTAGFANRMDASYVIHPKVGRMMLCNGMALGWCDRRNYHPRLHRALPNPHDVRVAQEQEE